MIIFSYVDNTTIAVTNASGLTIWTGTLDASQHQVIDPGPGVYRVEGDNPYSLLVGDAATRYVLGYYSVDQYGRGLSTLFYTYHHDTSLWDEPDWSKFIIFAYEDDTYVQVTNTETAILVWSGMLNAGQHYANNWLSDVYLTVSSNKPVSALSYSDQGFFVPADNGTFVGNVFHTWVGNSGDWNHDLNIISYNDYTSVRVANSSTGEEIWSGLLNTGEVHSVNGINGTYVTVETNNNIAVAVMPFSAWSCCYYYSAYGRDSSGSGIGNFFYYPAESGGQFIVFAYSPGFVSVTDSAGTEIWAGTLDAGESHSLFPSSPTIFRVSSTMSVSVMYDWGGAWGADFAPVYYAAPPITTWDYQPNPDGYRFQNHNGGPLTWEMFSQFMGSGNIEVWVDSQSYHLKAAQEFYDSHYRIAADGGVCDGMSATSLLFYRNLGRPLTDFDPAATETYDLNTNYDDSLWEHITYYQGYQLGREINVYRQTEADSQSPNSIFTRVKDEIALGNPDSLIIGIRSNDNKRGHSVVPYRVVENGDGTADVYVYDSNHPGQGDRKIHFDLNSNSWSYALRKFFWINFETWSGNADDHRITVAPLSLYTHQGTPWWSTSDSTLVPSAHLISVFGAADLLIADDQGRQLGYVGDQLVSNIPGASPFIVSNDGFDEGGWSEAYMISSSVDHSITIQGNDQANASLHEFRSGGLVRIDTAVTDATEDLVQITGTGTQVVYSTNDAAKPLSVSIDEETPGTSRTFTIANTEVVAGETPLFEVITGTNSIKYVNTGSNKFYDVALQSIGSEGVYTFWHPDVPVAQNDTHIIEVTDWTNMEEVTLYVDHGSDGTIDEVTTLDNTVRIYLPLILKNY